MAITDVDNIERDLIVALTSTEDTVLLEDIDLNLQSLALLSFANSVGSRETACASTDTSKKSRCARVRLMWRNEPGKIRRSFQTRLNSYRLCYCSIHGMAEIERKVQEGHT